MVGKQENKVSLLALSCGFMAVAFTSAIQFPADARAITNRVAIAVPDQPDSAPVEHRMQALKGLAKRTRVKSEMFVHDVDLTGATKTSTLVVVVISSDQLETVQKSMTALQDRADWLICTHGRVLPETKERLNQMSTETHNRFGTSVKIIRPLDDTLFVPKQVFWSSAIALDKDFMEQHENLWLIDSDINFEGFDLESYMARQTTAFVAEAPLVSQPIIKQSTQYFLYMNNLDSWQTKPDVSVAYSTLIEIQAAMVNTKFFIWLLERLQNLVDMQKQLRSDWIFDNVWCGGAALYLESVQGKKLKPGVSPCAIITLPIGHDDHHSIVKNSSFDQQNDKMKEWALSTENTAFHQVLQRQRDLVAEMQLFTPWPHQQCEACSTNQCSEGVPMGKCCWAKVPKSSASTSCWLNLAIADTKDITQVVTPAAQIFNPDRFRSFRSQPSSQDKLATNLQAAFEASNAALFILAAPDKLDRMMRLAQETFKLSLERIVVVPAVPAEFAPSDSLLVQRGIVSQSYWENVYAQFPTFSRGRVACFLAHTRAHKMFLDSTFDAALFLEDDIDETVLDISSENWQRKAHTVFTSEMVFGQTDSQDPVAVYLGYCFESCPSWARTYDLSDDLALRDADKPMCTHAYATNRKASESFLGTALPMADPVDLVMPLIFKASQVRSFIVNPPLLWQRKSDATDESRTAFCQKDDEDCACTSTA